MIRENSKSNPCLVSARQLEATVPSDEVGRNSDCENRTVIDMKLNDLGFVLKRFEKRNRLGGSWVEPLPITEKLAGTSR